MTMDEKLDEALKQTFPASDAFSLAPGASEFLRSTGIAPAQPRGELPKESREDA